MKRADSADAWVRARSASWNEWQRESRVPLERTSVEQAQRYVERYRALAQDLATARRLLPGSRVTAALEALYQQAHALIDQPPRYNSALLLRVLRDEIPATLRTLRPTLRWVVALLVMSALAGWWLISTYPELISLVASDRTIDSVEHGHLWTQDLFNVMPSSIESARILSNNVTVSLVVFCSGIFLGLGVGYFVALNGLMLGALLAFTHQHGLGGALVSFVLAHGPVELSVMCMAGGAGIALGEALLRPTLPTRRESFERAAHRMGPVLLVCALLLTVCALIEAFVSPDPRVPLAVRAVIGLGYWCAMVWLLSGRALAWTRRPAAQAPFATAPVGHGVPGT
jgi:uncharacterized membrane protein SpoIIM required for sporulation